jgi:hypothetical protein
MIVPSFSQQKIRLKCERAKASLKPRLPSVPRQCTTSNPTMIFHHCRREKGEYEEETG